MLITINSCSFSGRLTRNPVFRDLERNNLRVCNGSIAVNNQEKKDGQYVDSPMFIDLEAWGVMADVLSRCKQGTGIIATGRLVEDTYEKDGETRSKRKLIVATLNPLAESYKDESQSSSEPQKTRKAASDNLDFDATAPQKGAVDDDPPF